MKITTRQIALAGIMLALSAVLVNTPLGMIPVPTPNQYATIMHIPVIIVGILEGPIMGAITGLLFGLIALFKVPQFGPIVHLVPRPFIGLAAGFLYMFLSRVFSKWGSAASETISISVSATVGSLVNTVGVLGLAVIMKLMPLNLAMLTAATSGLPEAILSVLITLPIVLAVKKKFAYKYQSIQDNGS